MRRCGAARRAVMGCVGLGEGQEAELGLCRDTVFNLAEGTIEGKVLSMYSWVPSVPPARRRTELGSSSLPPLPSPPGQGLGWEWQRKRVLRRRVGKR